MLVHKLWPWRQINLTFNTFKGKAEILGDQYKKVYQADDNGEPLFNYYVDYDENHKFVILDKKWKTNFKTHILDLDV